MPFLATQMAKNPRFLEINPKIRPKKALFRVIQTQMRTESQIRTKLTPKSGKLGPQMENLYPQISKDTHFEKGIIPENTRVL